jgi:DNA mismatch repair ATPase MutL
MVLCDPVLQTRTLESCLKQLFQQPPSHQQHSPTLQHICSQHTQGWQVNGSVLTSPTPSLSTKQQQLLYVNNRVVSCPALAQLLRDWFTKHVKTLQAGPSGTGESTAWLGSGR